MLAVKDDTAGMENAIWEFREGSKSARDRREGLRPLLSTGTRTDVNSGELQFSKAAKAVHYATPRSLAAGHTFQASRARKRPSLGSPICARASLATDQIQQNPIKVKEKARRYLIPLRMRHAFCFNGVSWRRAYWFESNLDVSLTYTMICDG